MNIIKRDIYVLSDSKLPTPIDYVQGTNAIPVQFTFRDYTIPIGAKVRVLVEKPSCHKRFEDVGSVSGDVVTINPDQQMMAEAGISGLQIEVVKDREILATFVQPIHVKKSGIPIKSGSGSAFLEDLIADAETATDRANNVSDTIEQRAKDGEFSASVKIGKTDTGIPGTTAEVKNTGTTKDAVLDFVIPKGVKGDSGVIAPSKGYFTIWVDSETGDLYCDYIDGETPPQFELEENGDLYMLIPDEEVPIEVQERKSA